MMLVRSLCRLAQIVLAMLVFAVALLGLVCYLSVLLRFVLGPLERVGKVGYDAIWAVEDLRKACRWRHG